jgi:hypothetical protein
VAACVSRMARSGFPASGTAERPFPWATCPFIANLLLHPAEVSWILHWHVCGTGGASSPTRIWYPSARILGSA